METSTATSSQKRTRMIAGCAGCRERHVKCDSILPKCKQCQTHGLECDREVKLKFRYELSSGTFTGEAFPPGQVWVSLPSSLRYHNEVPDIVRSYRDAAYEGNAPPGTMINFVQENKRPVFVEPTDRGYNAQPEKSTTKAQELGSVTELFTAFSSRSQPFHEDTAPQISPTTARVEQVNFLVDNGSPASIPSHYSSSVHLTPRQDHFEPFTDREAELMRNFTENMALWVDIHDSDKHFEIEVPRRALCNTTLRYAIFSFSSRHMNRKIYKSDSEEALGYRHKALQLLIPQLSGPVEGLTEEHLAAVIILRLDEEMDMDDTQSHLAGATKILNSMALFGLRGGLQEACAWTCLRQDIYIALDTQQPLRTNLENFDRSQWIQKDDDMSWTSRIVLLLARILSNVFLHQSVEKTATIKQLAIEVEEWNQNKPLSFRPIKMTSRGNHRGQRLPVIWMLSPFHVAGLQYFHIAKILLLVTLDQNFGYSGFKNYQQSRKTEKTIREHLLTILGLAISNPRAENTLFQARHALAVWGGVLRHQLDQEAATKLLQFTQERTGWNMFKAMDALRELWHEDSD